MTRFRSLGACGALFLLAIARSAQAEWNVVSVEVRPATAPGVEYRRYSLGENQSGAETEIQLALFSPKKETLRVIDQPDFGDDLADAAARAHAVAGVNGGYFDPDGAPLGWLRSEGKTISPRQRSRLLTGVLIAGPGSLQLLRVNSLAGKRTAPTALQCGPFLIDGGHAVAGLEKTRRARRSFVALSERGKAALGDCAPVTLAELADALAALKDLQISRAMNLDGGSSSAFFCLTKSGTVSIPEEKRVRDFLVLTPSASR